MLISDRVPAGWQVGLVIQQDDHWVVNLRQKAGWGYSCTERGGSLAEAFEAALTAVNRLTG